MKKGAKINDEHPFFIDERMPPLRKTEEDTIIKTDERTEIIDGWKLKKFKIVEKLIG